MFILLYFLRFIILSSCFDLCSCNLRLGQWLFRWTHQPLLWHDPQHCGCRRHQCACLRLHATLLRWCLLWQHWWRWRCCQCHPVQGILPRLQADCLLKAYAITCLSIQHENFIFAANLIVTNKFCGTQYHLTFPHPFSRRQALPSQARPGFRLLLHTLF